MHNEVWKDVVGYEGLYEVSSYGNVRKADGTMLSTAVDNTGYMKVALNKDKTWKRYCVHVLVLSAFVCTRPAGMVARHLNSNKANNHVSNLSWGSSKDNGEDRIVHGILNAKISIAEAEKIKTLYSSGANNIKTLACKFCVTEPFVEWLVGIRQVDNIRFA